jgi:hypothetical protein
VPDDEKTVDVLGREYDAAGGLVYDAGGAHLAFRVLVKDALGVSLDGAKPALEFDFVDELTFGPNGQLAYVAATGCELDADYGWQVLEDMPEAEGGRWLVVQGETESAKYERTHLPTWSPDGSKLAFAAREKKSWRVVVGETSTDPCDEIARIVWAPDGSCVWYGARIGRDLWWNRLPVE